MSSSSRNREIHRRFEHAPHPQLLLFIWLLTPCANTQYARQYTTERKYKTNVLWGGYLFTLMFSTNWDIVHDYSTPDHRNSNVNGSLAIASHELAPIRRYFRSKLINFIGFSSVDVSNGCGRAPCFTMLFLIPFFLV